MKRYFWMALLGTLLMGCGKESPQTQSSPEVVAVAPEPMPDPVLRAPDHFYTMRDGFEYGYERTLSSNEINNGQAATTLVMIRYAGNKNGKHQIYNEDNGVFSVFECSVPCEFVKSMVFVDGEHVRTERMRAAGTIAEAALLDAQNGKLEQAERKRKSQPNKSYHLWFDEDNGPQLTPIQTH